MKKISIFVIIKKIPKFFIQFLDMVLWHVILLFYPKKQMYKNAWLICERGVEAQDNGYWMFKYIKEKHPEINCYYIINKNNKKDYDKVKKLGPVIELGSFEHKIAFLMSKVLISTHLGTIINWNYLLYKKLFYRKNNKKFIWLQHGIIKDDISNIVNKNIISLDIFVTSTVDEANSIKENPNYGFIDEVKLTGLARFDNLNHYKLKNQILFMPTWRSYILTPSYKKEKLSDKELFLNSDYYETINSFLNNKEIIKLLKESNTKLIFYPHFEIQKYLNLFNIKEDNNIILANKEEYNVQTLLKESKLLITDYSSVFFDFAYMKKPTILYQFDQDEYFKKHYQKGYFDYKKDCFGDICVTEKELLNSLKKIINNNFKIEDKYLNKVNKTFKYFDNKNCERIYEEILKIL